jgi:hypothetical protein
VNSLIDGWRDPDGRFRAYFVPEQLSIPGYPHSRRWCFTLIPGWRDLVSTPIPQIALRQWAEYAKAIARVRAMLPKSQFSEIFLNELRASPAPVIEQLAGEFELELSPTLLNEMCDLTKVNVNSFSDNTETAWRSRNRAEIEALLPEIATLAPCVGYEIDPVTGFAAQMPPFEAPVEASSLAFDNAQRI